MARKREVTQAAPAEGPWGPGGWAAKRSLLHSPFHTPLSPDPAWGLHRGLSVALKFILVGVFFCLCFSPGCLGHGWVHPQVPIIIHSLCSACPGWWGGDGLEGSKAISKESSVRGCLQGAGGIRESDKGAGLPGAG